MMLTILGNLQINTPIKLRHLKDSFNSFKNTSDNWLINIRGNLRNEALEFLRNELKDNMTEFSLLDDDRGWSKNALEMVKQAKYPYLLIWNEDHLNIAPQSIFPEMIQEMLESRSDFMMYSFYYHHRVFKEVEFTQRHYIKTVHLTKKIWRKMTASGSRHFIFSLPGIYSKKLLTKLLEEDARSFYMNCLLFFRGLLKLTHLYNEDNQKYLHHINHYIFGNRLPRFSKNTPFNLEKDCTRTDLLPFNLAIPQQELFACIDDDNTIPDSCLIKRGLYEGKFSTEPKKYHPYNF